MSKKQENGAGVDPVNVVNGTNRLKQAHRRARVAGDSRSLKQFARDEVNSEEQQTEGWDLGQFALTWQHRKSAEFTAKARKARRARVSALQSVAKANKPSGGKKR